MEKKKETMKKGFSSLLSIVSNFEKNVLLSHFFLMNKLSHTKYEIESNNIFGYYDNSSSFFF